VVKRYTFFTDVHEYGAHAMSVDWEYGPECFSLGDNVDLSCCRWDQFWLAWQRRRELKEKFGERYIPGNHELELGDNDFLKVDHILMTHGDYLFWSLEHAERYRKQKPCAGFFKYWFTKIVFGWILSQVTWPIRQIVKERAYKLAKRFECSIVVCGHWHPTKLVKLEYKGITLIVLPRGKTTLEL
jgi:hypothetical protein